MPIPEAITVVQKLRPNRRTPEPKAADRPLVLPDKGPLSRWRHKHELPHELLQEAVRRLGLFAMFLTIASCTTLLLPIVVPHFSLGTDVVRTWILLPLVAISIGVAYASFRLWITPERVLHVAQAYQLAVCTALAFTVNTQPWPHELLPGWSPVAVVLLVAPIIVPSTSAITLMTSLLSAAIDPLSLFVCVRAGLLEMPPADLMMLRFYPLVIAVPLAVGLSRIVHRLGERIARAEDMGSYHLIEPVGSGGMGEVWRASHRRLAREAAVKLIRPEMLAGAGGAQATMVSERFEREARSIAALRSPHTVQLYDSGVAADGTLFYVMELLDGVDLETLVREDGPQPAERVIQMLRQACHSLREAHARGLVHRDIKPANMMLCRYGEDLDHLKVLDFGLVREVVATSSLMTGDNVVAGTPAYLAPEIATGDRPIDARTDLYALGCTAYFLLTGALVFDSKSALQLAVAHATELPVRPSLRTTQPIPPALERIVMRCLEKSPDDRPADAVTLDADLAAIALATPWTDARARGWWAEWSGDAS